ncbi:MAG: cobyric acid synthase, partial [Thermoplasmatales archaeon]|nr:cobyric acid synthase [Thermoplasmatales archaeon]
DSVKLGKVWSCAYCNFIHKRDAAAYVHGRLRDAGITGPEDPFLEEIFRDAKARFHRKGKTVMVLGATSDAGKSVIVTAICRILSDRGYSVTPFKSQNMSLNSRVTRKGHEISMIQDLQARAAGVSSPSFRINPILMKPKGDGMSQVVLEGLPAGDYSSTDYYSKFVPGPGTEALKESIGFLRNRYDFVVMEGAGSPAEINIYDSDIANMRAAEAADADCILVVNVEWGGSYAYAVGTLDLMHPKDRERVKAIILNNLKGNPSGMRTAADEIERLTGVPVIGIIPHLDFDLPKEDSESFRGIRSLGSGRTVVAVPKFPRISNFTDLDPLLHEDVTVRFVSSAEEMEGISAVVLPGTKNTISDLEWMKGTGIADRIVSMKGKVPILGICGGYQMMGRVLRDPFRTEGDITETDGLGLFDMSTEWPESGKVAERFRGTYIPTGDIITGYETHSGTSTTFESPMFEIKGGTEGSLREDEMLFGTYVHGLFDKPGLRRHFLSGAGCEIKGKAVDHDEYVEINIDKLAHGVMNAMDMEMFNRIFSEERS